MLGESLNGALPSLKSLHRRLSQDAEMAKEYTCFMMEYARLGHMRPIPPLELGADTHPTYYIPHHGIWQRGDHRRRLRVVFNLCSCVRITAQSGQTQALSKDRFVDHILTGCDDLREAKELRDQLIHLLQLGGFPLRKWVANQPELLEDLSEQDRLRPTWLQLCSNGLINELGVCWDPQNDCFRLTPPEIESLESPKRNLLATIARLFDPCGWIAPVILLAKILVQDLWRAGLEWDEPIPQSYAQRWAEFTTNLKAIGELSIPRWINTQPTAEFQLHVFSDASRRAMAATVYSRVSSGTSQTHTRLLAAKTKLSPIRSLRPPATQIPRMTIPRLELRAALLAAQLLRSLASDSDVPLETCVAWTDSQIVLHWLRSNEPTGNSWVDNYVEHIQELLPTSIWRPIPTKSNPADLATRGVEPSQLSSCRLWWTGPDWLAASDDLWPPVNNSAPVDFFVNSPTSKVCCALKSCSTELLGQYSDLGRLLRVIGHMLHWIKYRRQSKDPVINRKCITTDELKAAFLICVRMSQSLWFEEELERLRSPAPPPARSSLKVLGTFIDADGIIRVGGRLQNSSLPYAERHPPVIDGRCSLAGLIISWAHQRSLHGGFRATYVYTLHRAWILGGKRRIRSSLTKCVICVRSRAQLSNQAMAPLPAARVTPNRPCSKTGLDYAGPFQILSARGRDIRSTKGYLVVFVCFTTKMLHL